MKRYLCLVLVALSILFAFSSCEEEWHPFVLLGVKVESEVDIYSLEEGYHLVMCKNIEMQEKMGIKKFLITVEVGETGIITIETMRLAEKEKMEENNVSEKAAYLFSEFRQFRRIGNVWVETNSPLFD